MRKEEGNVDADAFYSEGYRGEVVTDRAVEIGCVAEAFVAAAKATLIIPFGTNSTFGRLPDVADVLGKFVLVCKYWAPFPIFPASFPPSFPASRAHDNNIFSCMTELFAPAHVSASRGSSLALIDIEKTQPSSNPKGRQEEGAPVTGATGDDSASDVACKKEDVDMASQCVSFDLASGVALEIWYQLLQQYQNHLNELWKSQEPDW